MNGVTEGTRVEVWMGAYAGTVGTVVRKYALSLTGVWVTLDTGKDVLDLPRAYVEPLLEN